MGQYEMEQARRQSDALVEMCRRDSQASGVSLPFMPANGLGGLGTFMEGSSKLQGTIEQLRHYRDWVFAAVRPIANRLAGQPIHMGSEPASGSAVVRGMRRIKRPAKTILHRHLQKSADTLELIDRHPLLDAIENPNPIMVRWTLIYLLVAHLELTGKAYWWFTPSEDGEKLDIWPLPPSWVTPKHSDTQLFAQFSIIPPGAAGEPKLVPGDEVAYFHYPDPSDPTGAAGPLQAQARAVSSDESIQLAQAVSFKNSIYPGLAIIVGDALAPDNTNKRPLLDSDQRQDILAPIKDQYRGVLKYGEPIILDALVRDVKQISMKPAEMDFLNSGKQTKERIFQGYCVNPIIAGEIENANRASSAVADEHFCNAINPKAELISQVMTKMLGPTFARNGEKVYIWIEPCRPNDTEGRREDYKLGWQMGAVTRNEYRRDVLNLPPLDDGDSVLIPATMAIQGASVAGSASRSLQPAERKGVMTKAAYGEMWLKMHEAGEGPLIRDLKRFFADQADRVEKALRERFDGGDKAWLGILESRLKSTGQGEQIADQVFRPSEWYEKLEEVCRPHLLKSAAIGAALEISAVRKVGCFATKDSETDISVDIPQEVLDHINSDLDQSFDQPYWHKIQETTREELSRIFEEAVKNGDTLKQIIRSVQEVLGDDQSQRAENIARTELTGAMNSGHYAARQELIDEGYVTGSEWLATEDGLTRPTHVSANGQIIRKGEQFSVGGQKTPYPGWYGMTADERCGCRCTTVAAGTFADDEGDENAGAVAAARLAIPCQKHALPAA